jgi:hypothetical protein
MRVPSIQVPCTSRFHPRTAPRYGVSQRGVTESQKRFVINEDIGLAFVKWSATSQ